MSTASGSGIEAAAGDRSAEGAPVQPGPSSEPERPRSSRSVADMFRSLAVVGVIVAIVVVLNYRPSEDPVKEIDPTPVAQSVAHVAPFPVLLPTDPGWRATAVRWEPTEESGDEPVWFVGGVKGSDGPFASVSQSTVNTPAYLAEQTAEGTAKGEIADVLGGQWQRYESPDGRSLVLIAAGATTVVSGTGDWEDLERFAASLEPVAGASPKSAGA